MSNPSGGRGGWAPRGGPGGNRGGRGGNSNAGRGAGQGQGAGQDAGQGIAPLHAPTGPSAQRQGCGRGGNAGGQNAGVHGGAGRGWGGGDQGGAAGGEHGGYQAGGGRGQGRYASNNAGGCGGLGGNTNTQHIPTTNAPKPLNPADFKPPKGNYVDQSAIGGVGVKPIYPDCLRCAEPKGISHPSWMDCKNKCGFCHKLAHPGLSCLMTYCSDKWWRDHLGHDPEGVQRRPSEMQRQRLAEIDPFFASFPQPLDPIAKRAEENKKRSYAETMSDEVEQAKWKAGEEVLKRQKRELETKVEEEKGRTIQAQRERLDAEQEMRKEKLARLSAEMREADMKKAKESVELQNGQLQTNIAEYEANQLRFAAKISSRESAVQSRERAKYDSALQAFDEFWQLEFEDFKTKANLQLQNAIAQAKRDGAREYAESHQRPKPKDDEYGEESENDGPNGTKEAEDGPDVDEE